MHLMNFQGLNVGQLFSNFFAWISAIENSYNIRYADVTKSIYPLLSKF